ncbi:MAG: YggU family protein [Peptococcaceae bacterium]|nr:YggU family protein [Peptococcaceae bacterium]
MTDVDIKDDQDGVTIRVRIQPRASKNQFAGILDGAVKVRLSAPPVDGEANDACIKFFSSFFKVSAGSVKILSGFTGKNKIIKISGLSTEDVLSRISLD